MEISLNWQDLVKLALNGRVEKDKVTVAVEQPVLANIVIARRGLAPVFVQFSLDDTDPCSQTHGEATVRSAPGIDTVLCV
jgi:hypothetical protein